jgi:hypothetical protein
MLATYGDAFAAAQRACEREEVIAYGLGLVELAPRDLGLIPRPQPVYSVAWSPQALSIT